MDLHHKSNRHSRGVISLLLVLVSCSTAHGQNITGESPLTEEEATAMDKAIEPVYYMAEIFLESIIKPTNLSKLNATVDMSDFNAVFKSLTSEWKVWVAHYSAYVVCLVLGALYILILPITGCIICGCRSRGKCRTNRSHKPSKKEHWCRRICTVLFLLLCIGVLFGVVCMFLATEALNNHTKQSGLPHVLQDSVVRLDTFLDVARTSFDTFISTELMPKVEAFRDRLSNDIPGEVQDQVGVNTGIGPLLDTLTAYTSQLNTTKNNLIAIDRTVDNLKAKTTTLEAELVELRNNISSDFSSCSTTACEYVKTTAASLEVIMDFSTIGSLASVIAKYNTVLTGSDNIYSNMNKAQAAFNQIQDAVRNGSATTIDGLNTEGTKVIEEIQSFLNKTLDDLEDLLPLDTATTSISDKLNPAVERYGDYIYYAGLAISSAMLLVATLCFIGLLFGACGSHGSQRTECCKKSSAISVLKAGLVFLFLFGCIIMIVVAVLFPVGGLLHNEVCRHFELPAPDPQSAQVVDDMITNSLNLPASFLETYSNCQQQQSLYSALKLHTRDGLDLDSILDPDGYEVRAKLDELAQGSYDPGAMDIVSEELLDNIKTLEDATNQTDFSPYLTELNKNVISVDLEEFSEFLAAVASNASTDATLFSFYASSTNDILQNEYAAVGDGTSILAELIKKVNTFRDQFNERQTVFELEGIESSATVSVVSTAVSNVTQVLMNDFTELLNGAKNSVKSDVARCGPVGDIIAELLNGVCQGLLDPYNAFWFSAGWCLVFFIFVIPITVVLMDFFKTKPFYNSATPETTSTSSTTELVRRDRRRGSDRSKYNGRPLPDPNNTEPRAGRVPYQDLPVVSGARSSPVQQPRHYNNGFQESPRQGRYDRQWANLAYDDTDPHPERDSFNWTADSQDLYLNNAGADPYIRDNYNPAYEYNHSDPYRQDHQTDPYRDRNGYNNNHGGNYNQHNNNRRTMYPDDEWVTP